MDLTSQEKEVIVSILKKHIAEVENTEHMANQMAAEFAGEVKYDEFLKGIITKME